MGSNPNLFPTLGGGGGGALTCICNNCNNHCDDYIFILKSLPFEFEYKASDLEWNPQTEVMIVLVSCLGKVIFFK